MRTLHFIACAAISLALLSCGSDHGDDSDLPALTIEIPTTGIHPGTVLVLRAEEDIAVAPHASLDSVGISLSPADVRHLTAFVPLEFEVGSAKLVVDGFAPLSLDIIAGETITDPQGYVVDRLAPLRAEIDAEIASGDMNITPFANEASNALALADQALAAATPEQLAMVAALLAANPSLLTHAVPLSAFTTALRQMVAYIDEWAIFIAAGYTAVEFALVPVAREVAGVAVLIQVVRLLKLHYDASQPVILNGDSVATAQRTLVAGAMTFTNMQTTALDVFGDFRSINTSDVSSSNAVVAQVARIFGAIGNVYVRIASALGKELPPLPTANTSVVHRHLRIGEIAVASTSPEVLAALSGPDDTDALITATASGACTSDIDFSLIVSFLDVPDPIPPVTLPATLRCGADSIKARLVSVQMPTTQSESGMFATRVNADTTSDNQLGQVNASLVSSYPQCGVPTTSTNMTPALLMQLDTLDSLTPPTRRLRVYTDTGNLTPGMLLIDATSTDGYFSGATAAPSIAIELPFMGQLKATQAFAVAMYAVPGPNGTIEGNLGGAVSSGQVAGDADDHVTNDIENAEWGCISTNPDQTTLSLFDTNHDGIITFAEYTSNSLVVSLHAPDLTIGSAQGLSFGMHFTSETVDFTLL